MPKVSVIIPVYNVEQYVEKSIQSVLNQSMKEIEVILVDDGSMDTSGEICDRYGEKEERIIVIHKENGGLSSARNAGVQAASGDYIGFIDSDDYIDSVMYETLYRMAERESADVAVCGVYDVYKNGKVPQCASREAFVCDQEEMLGHILLGEKISGTVCNKLIRKDIAKELEFPVGKLFEDAFYSAMLVQKIKKVSVTTEPMYFYVHRSDSITTCGYRRKDLDVIEAFEIDKQLVINHFPKLIDKAEFALNSAYLRVLDKMLLTKGYRKFPEYKIVKKYIKEHGKDIIFSPYFRSSRKVAVQALRINILLYKYLLILNERVNRKQL